MPECPHCYFFDSVQSTVDVHVDNIHETTPGGVLIPETVVDKIAASWDCESSGLLITTNYRGLIVNDQYNVIADADIKKWILVRVLQDIGGGTNEVFVFERFDSGEYAAIPSGKEIVETLRQFSLEAAGTNLIIEDTPED